MTPIDAPMIEGYIDPMIWPNLIGPLEPEQRYAWIKTLASSETLPTHEWGTAMIEHVERAISQGWPLHKALTKAAAECACHRPKDI